MNRAIIIGRLTRDPEVRKTSGDISVCSFTVAVDRRFRSQNGESTADFIPVVAWRTTADNCGRYLHKGSQVGVCGSIQTRSYDASDGSKRYVTEIVADEVEFLGSRGDNAPQSDSNAGTAGTQRSSYTRRERDMEPVVDDDLPF